MVDESTLPEPVTPERLETLGEEIATFAARIDVAEHALITRLRLFDAHEAWGPAGFKSCAEWLSWRIGIGITAAREKVRVARALGTLKKVDELFGRGELSYSKVRAITRVATPASEQDFIDVALHATASQIERVARAYQRVRDAQRGPMELPRNHRRFVRQSETVDGMVRIEIQLPPEEAAIVWEAILSAMDQEQPPARAKESAEAVAQDSGAAQAPAAASATQDSAETLALGSAPCSAADAPAAGHASAESSAVSVEQNYSIEERCADAIVDVARAYLKQRPPTLGSGYELVVITTKHQLEHGHDGVGGWLPNGTPVPLQMARMLASGGPRVDVVTGADGALLDVGRRTRQIPSAIGRALRLRDGGCRVPGARRPPSPEGGGHANAACVRNQMGRVIPRVAASAGMSGSGGHELEELERYIRAAELHVDADAAASQWDGSRIAIEEMLDWMFIAERTRGSQTIGGVSQLAG